MIRIAKTENGLVEGLPAADPRITSYKGIPFAAPPIGDKRWCAPSPAENWEGTYKAYQFAPISMQPPVVIDEANIYTREWSIDPDIEMNEDCLYLNVWTPAQTEDAKYPVFVWYFGGGLQVGHTAEMEFDGERIARRGIVVVTINYRLNGFGFLCHPEITAENPDAPANFGHLDQQYATNWVKRNIAAFGGDPENITIGGQSAGGASVLSQIACSDNIGLFRGAIIQSGLFLELYPDKKSPLRQKTLKDAEEEGKRFFDFLGVTSLKEARAIPSTELSRKIQEYGKPWGTVIDGAFCTENTYQRFIHGKGCNVPVMAGLTADEFYSKPDVKTNSEFESLAKELFGDSAEEFLKITGDGELDDRLKKASLRSIEYAVRVANRCRPEMPFYYYVFDTDIPGWDNPGTFHSVDLWFFFETLAKCWRPFTGKHYDLARQMCDYWCNFIKTASPNGAGTAEELLPYWEKLNPDSPKSMYFAKDSRLVEALPNALMEFAVDYTVNEIRR